jgi:hypothetical protein
MLQEISALRTSQLKTAAISSPPYFVMKDNTFMGLDIFTAEIMTDFLS